MPTRRFRAILAIALTLGLFVAALVPSQARAVTVTVGGITYDVQFNETGTTGTSFDADSVLIQASPWWGNATLASDFATAYNAAVTPSYPFDLDYGASSTDNLFFSYATDGTNNDFAALGDNGTQFSSFTTNTAIFNSAFYAFASASAAPVPEIDGGALGQGAVILLALWLMLRRRVAVRPQA